MIEKYLIALQMLIEGEAVRLEAGDVIFQKIVPGLIFIHLGHQNYLYEQVSGEYSLRAIP
jgi:hypothetical protein